MPRLRRSDLITCAVDEEIVVLDRAAGYVHQLNATASQIWRACDGRHSVEDIAAQVTQRFDIAPDAVLRDVHTALAEFERLGLLDRNAVEPCGGSSNTGQGPS
jgi:PqqD family protein of HPr-rel-A system